MKIARYVRKPFEVDAVQITKENIQEVAKWCEGTVTASGKGIRLNRKRNGQLSETTAAIGSWVLKSPEHFSVFHDRNMQETFEPVVHVDDSSREELIKAAIAFMQKANEEANRNE